VDKAECVVFVADVAFVIADVFVDVAGSGRQT